MSDSDFAGGGRPAALVTGAARGIGRSTVLALARVGYDVAVNYASSKSAAEQVAAEAEAAGARVLVCQADVADEAAVTAMVEVIGETFGRLDALVNNAGTTIRTAPADEPPPALDGLDMADWDRVFAVNVRGLFQVTRACVPLLGNAERAAVVNLASIVGLRPGPQPFPYAASKAAVVNLTKTLAGRLGPEGIRVNAVAPGWMVGEWMQDQLGDNYDRLMERRARHTPLRRCVTPDEVADTVLSLIVSNPFVTGEIVVIDGGYSAHHLNGGPVPLLDVRTESATAVLTLADPGRRNILSGALVGEIVEAFDALEADPGVTAVVLIGAGTAFCAGADLADLLAAADGDASGVERVYEGFLRVARSPLPTVAAVNGPAVGAGLNLALACDVRIAAESARFDARFLRLGLHPGGGHTWMLHRLVGPQTAAAMVLFGERLDGAAAVAAGLAYRCVPDAELLDAARTLAAGAADTDRELVRRAKRSLGAASIGTHEEAVAAETREQMWSLTLPGTRETLRRHQRS